jgi:hypothetical protein
MDLTQAIRVIHKSNLFQIPHVLWNYYRNLDKCSSNQFRITHVPLKILLVETSAKEMISHCTCVFELLPKLAQDLIKEKQ